jgi:pyruvate dehydrogenase E1 component beta subunit
MGVPGLWMVAPNVLASPGDLLRRAVEHDHPTIFLESKTCYSRPVVERAPGLTIAPIDRDAPFPTLLARHDRSEPSDGLMWCYGGMTPHCLDAVQRLAAVEGLYIDLAVLSQLSPLPVDDIGSILDAARPSLSVYVEEANACFGWTAEMLARVQERVGAASPAAIRHERIGAANTPIPSGRELERAALPQVDDIVSRVLECF